MNGASTEVGEIGHSSFFSAPDTLCTGDREVNIMIWGWEESSPGRFKVYHPSNSECQFCALRMYLHHY